MENILRTTDLTKNFGRTVAINNINLSVDKGDIYGLIGKNGAGKTTLMRMILGSCIPTSGEIFYNDQILNQGKNIGSIIENPSFYKSCSAIENLKRFSILFGSDNKQIEHVLSCVGLSNVKHKKVRTFSLGMKQRLGIAIALLGNPQFLILDEPTNGLDPAGIMEIRDLILDLNRELGITFLISTHMLDELFRVATKFAILNNGSLIDEISTDELQIQCQKRIDIYVEDKEKAVKILSDFVEMAAIKIEKDYISILSNIEKSGQFNKILCDNDVLVSRLELKQETLEQYFFRKVGSAYD